MAAMEARFRVPSGLTMCGRQAIDGDTAQVGPQIAEKLGLPQVSYAAEITKEGDTLTVKRMLEDGYMTITAHHHVVLLDADLVNGGGENLRGGVSIGAAELTGGHQTAT